MNDLLTKTRVLLTEASMLATKLQEHAAECGKLRSGYFALRCRDEAVRAARHVQSAVWQLTELVKSLEDNSALSFPVDPCQYYKTLEEFGQPL